MLGYHLNKFFIVESASISSPTLKHEIGLFRALINSFEALKMVSSNVVVTSNEVHQQYCYFDVDPTFYVGGLYDVKREIGDVVIIAYSPTRQISKITFVQCKHDQNIIKSSFKSFKGDIFQYYLMVNRPYIKRTKNPILTNTKDLFQHALIPSITSYGVFYHNGSNYDMAYLNSKYLNQHGTPFGHKASPQRIDFLGIYSKIDKVSTFYDTQGEENIINFGDSIESMKIGTPITINLHKTLIRLFPNAPDSFKNLSIMFDNINDNDNFIMDNLSTKTTVFINVDTIEQKPFSDDQYHLYIRLNS